MKIVAIGRTEILYDSIIKLSEAGHEIALIISCEEASNNKKTASDFRALAEKLDVEFIQTERINSSIVIEAISIHKPDVAISVNWKTLIGQKVIECFPYGIVNAHAGDLPRYRGNAVPNWAIINGEQKVVLTLHLMNTELDSGPILVQRDYKLSDTTYVAEVYHFIQQNAPQMFLEIINGFSNGSVVPIEQPCDPSLSQRCFPRIPRDSEIDWKLSSIELCNLVRAVSEPFNGAYSFIRQEKIIIWRARYEIPNYSFSGIPGQVAERRIETGEVAVITGEGFLILQEVETKNCGRRKASDVIKSIRTRLGVDISGELMYLLDEIKSIKNQLKIN